MHEMYMCFNIERYTQTVLRWVLKICTPTRNTWESLTLRPYQHNILFNFCTLANLICGDCLSYISLYMNKGKYLAFFKNFSLDTFYSVFY